MVVSSRSETFIRRICSSSSSGDSSSGGRSATDCLFRAYLLGVDLLKRCTLREPGDLPLGRVRSRDREVLGRAQLLRDGLHPLDQLLDRGAGGTNLVGPQVDELAAETPADRTPEVLLDVAVRRQEQLLALVDRTCNARSERVGQ